MVNPAAGLAAFLLDTHNRLLRAMGQGLGGLGL